MSRQVLFLLFDEFAALDAVGPADVFCTANDISRQAHYSVRYLSIEGSVKSSNGMVFHTEIPDGAPLLPKTTLLLPGGSQDALKRAIKTRHLIPTILWISPQLERLCSVCSGAFLLAQAGLLNGRRATTHWRGIERLKVLFPQVRVVPDTLFVQDGNLWTSAGVTAGIDMALAMVEHDHGRALALAVARELVLFMVRPGGQAQFSAPLELQVKASGSMLEGLPSWLEGKLSESVSVADMAESVGLSERHFHRRCVANFGHTPNALLKRLRLDRARSLLEESDLRLAEIASLCGFNDVSSLGKCFRRQFNTTPEDYRAHFGVSLT